MTMETKNQIWYGIAWVGVTIEEVEVSKETKLTLTVVERWCNRVSHRRQKKMASGPFPTREEAIAYAVKRTGEAVQNLRQELQCAEESAKAWNDFAAKDS
jgi:hypothetical protein